MKFPELSHFESEVEIHSGDSNIIVECVDEVDLAYIDPPYNQLPYGSNYFMLNLIVDYVRHVEISQVSGIPQNWNRSFYNKKASALMTFKDLIEKV